MFALMNNFVASLLLSSAMLTDPTTPKALPFDASAFVTINNQIRLSVNKNADVPVVVTLRNEDNEVLYRRTIGKNELKSAILFTVNDLTDGQYELEVRSNEGSIRKQMSLKTAPVKAPVRVIAMQ